MYRYLSTVVICAVAGCLLATVFMTPGGAVAGGVKGTLLGLLIAWGEWKSRRAKRVTLKQIRA